MKARLVRARIFASTCAIMSLLIIVSGSSPPAIAATTSTSPLPPLEIDRGLFSATLPSYAEVGGNYTVKILVTNHMNASLPILLRLETPVDAVYVHPLLVEGRISPYGQFLANFTFIPFNSSFQGPLNVTAALSVWFLSTQNRPQPVDSASFLVYEVRPHVAYQALLILAGVLVLALVAAVIMVLSRSEHGGTPGH